MLKILKIGGSILTDKKRLEWPQTEEIERIAKEVAESSSDLILVHGAGSFGHIHAKKYNLKERFSPEGVLETHRSVVRLNTLLVEALSQSGANPVPVHPLSCTLLKEGRIVRMEAGPIFEMTKLGLLPVIHGDVAMDRSKGAGIVSGDQIVSYLASSLNPELVALGTAVDGVISGGGPLARVTRDLLPQIDQDLGGSAGVDVTGGMKGKLSELLELADRGVRSVIFNAGRKGMVERALRGERVGTLVEGRE